MDNFLSIGPVSYVAAYIEILHKIINAITLQPFSWNCFCLESLCVCVCVCMRVCVCVCACVYAPKLLIVIHMK